MADFSFSTRVELDQLLASLPLAQDERQTIDRLLRNAEDRIELPIKPLRPPSLAAVARDLYRSSVQRTELFGSDICATPMWNMLLDLFMAGEDAAQVSVSSLCIASGEPTTSALRHIRQLEELGLIRRDADTHDHRRRWVSLTKRADLIVRRVLADCYRAGVGGQPPRIF